MIRRLSPGDPAPGLKLAQALNRDELPPIAFDRASLIILWNAGCAGCLPIIEDLSATAASFGVPCYGVAVMVRNVEATAEVARTSTSGALLALEEPPDDITGISRGWVTRHWLEASGQQGVPAGFLVDGAGNIAWMGDPADLKPLLPGILNGNWDVAAARKEWNTRISDEDIRNRYVVREVTDALVSGNVETADKLIEAAETEWPSVKHDGEFNVLKLMALAADPGRHELALRHYADCAERFRHDIDLQLRLASFMTTLMRSSEPASRAVITLLTRLEQEWNGVSDGSFAGLRRRLSLHLTLAQALKHSGSHREAEGRIEQATALSQDESLPENARRAFASSIEQVKNLIGNPIASNSQEFGPSQTG